MIKKIDFPLLKIIIASILLLQSCEVAYISKINISETFVHSTNSDGSESETIINPTFAHFCSEVNFSPQSNEYLFLEKDTEVIAACGRAWFHSARLWKKNGLYEIDLFLMQPGPWKPTRPGFCSETKEMSDYFSAKFGASNLSINLDSSCK